MDTNVKSRFFPCGMATGIGSVPFEEPFEALDLILTAFPECPHWPQMPQRGEQEHFVHQFLHPLVQCGLLVRQSGRWLFDMSRDMAAESLTTFYTAALAAESGDEQALRSFLPSTEAAAGFQAFFKQAESDGFLERAVFLKGQIAGPLTVSLELKDEEGRAAYYREDLRDVVVKNLSLNAKAQARALSSLGRPAILFVDDPAVGALGSWAHLTLSRETVQGDLNLLFSAIQGEGALSGIHACEAVDWSLLTDSGADIISVDVYRYGSSLIPYAEDIRGFLDRNGIMAWGITPTLDDPFDESVESLLDRLEGLWAVLFPGRTDLDPIRRQSMITPACGTGLLTHDRAREIYRLTAEVARRVSVEVKQIQ